jgi:hypothetical protein
LLFFFARLRPHLGFGRARRIANGVIHKPSGEKKMAIIRSFVSRAGEAIEFLIVVAVVWFVLVNIFMLVGFTPLGGELAATILMALYFWRKMK